MIGTIRPNVTPLHRLNPIARKKIMAQLKSVTLEQRMLALLLTTMVNQLTERDRLLPYVQKNLTRLRKVNGGTAYAPEIIEAVDRIWKETFEEMNTSVSIATFANAIIFRRTKQFKKIGINPKHFAKLSRLHGGSNLTMPTLKLVNLMLKKIDERLEEISNRIEELADTEIGKLKIELAKFK